MRDRAWFVSLYGGIIPSFSEVNIDRTGAQTMLYLTCTTVTSVDLAHYGVFHAKDLISVDCGTIWFIYKRPNCAKGKWLQLVKGRHCLKLVYLP